MSKKFINNTHIEGYVYEHNLELKTSGPNSKNPGTQFISGNLSVATDEKMMNIIQIHFTYVTETTNKGKANPTFNILKSIIDEKIGSYMKHGKENAGKVRIDSALDLNDYPDRNNEGQFVSLKRNEGGFVHQTNELCDEKDRATFNVDMVITGATRVEPNEERNLPEKVVVKGYIFNFRGEVLPYDFSVTHPGAMDYFEGLEASGKHPVFTRVQGNQVSQVVVREIVEPSAFGDDAVRKVKSSYRDLVINWAQAEPYVWDDETTILSSELAQKLSERELKLADIKKRQDDFYANRGNAIPTATNSTSAHKDDYDF